MVNRAIAVIITDDNDRILLARRGQKSRSEFGKWENPGGKIEPKESAEEAAKREIKEELGVQVNLLETLYTDVFGEWQVTVFKGKLIGEPHIQESDFISEIRWFNHNQLATVDLTSYTRADFIRLGWIKE